MQFQLTLSHSVCSLKERDRQSLEILTEFLLNFLSCLYIILFDDSPRQTFTTNVQYTLLMCGHNWLNRFRHKSDMRAQFWDDFTSLEFQLKSLCSLKMGSFFVTKVLSRPNDWSSLSSHRSSLSVIRASFQRKTRKLAYFWFHEFRDFLKTIPAIREIEFSVTLKSYFADRVRHLQI